MPSVVASAGTVSNASGHSAQGHLFHDGSRWWVLYAESGAGTSLKSAHSTDMSSWTAGATLTLSQTHENNGRYHAATFKNISDNLVIHQSNAYDVGVGDFRLYHARGTISGTTLTWGSEAQITPTATDNDTTGPCGQSLCFRDDNRITIAQSQYVGGNANGSNPEAVISTNADSGSSWTSGWGSPSTLETLVWHCNALAAIPLGTDDTLAIFDGGAGTGITTTDEYHWSLHNGTSWSAAANLLGVTLGTEQTDNDWGAVKRNDTDVHFVCRTGSDTYLHRRFDGAAWIGGQTIPTQTSKAGQGMFLASDGTYVWLFVIDSDANNTVRVIRWAGGWESAWETVESSAETRTSLSGWPTPVSNLVGLLWTEDAGGGNFDVVADTHDVTVTADATKRYPPWRLA